MSYSESEDPSFDWYGLVSGKANLEQGDLLGSFPIPILPLEFADSPDETETYELDSPIRVQRFNVVVLTQSCDLERYEDEEEVLLCPRYDYKDIAKVRQGIAGKGGWGNLVAGRVIGTHLINKCDLDAHEFDYQVVDLRSTFSIRFGVVKRLASSRDFRVRLLPPYREHLGQAFARQFMRVGLPIDLPSEYPYG